MSILSRNALFDTMLLVLITMLTYLVLEQRQGLWFVFLTELYLAVLDTFLPYDASAGIVRTLIFGFLLLSVSHLMRMTSMATVTEKRSRILFGSLLASLLVIMISVGIGYAAPKKDASWPDPIAFLLGSGMEGSPAVMKKSATTTMTSAWAALSSRTIHSCLRRQPMNAAIGAGTPKTSTQV